MTTATKYHNRFLFDLSGEEIDSCILRLERQTEIYLEKSDFERRRMETRGLFTAAMTLNATAVWTAKLLVRGTFSMISQTRFFRNRLKKSPADWGASAKSCFARALSGYSIGPDGVCVDRHLERTNLAPENAAGQWREWFRLYESIYGPGEAVGCVKWHKELLDWIAGLAEKPEPWK